MGALHMIDITRDQFSNLSNKEKNIFLCRNFTATKRGISIRRLVYGFGVNDAAYSVSPEIGGAQVKDPCYVDWKSALERCYSKKYHLKKPTYIGVSMCDEWLVFSNFREWWLDNQVDDYELDKDLLSDGMMYSPDRCIYVPMWLNTFLSDSGSSRGEFPVGVHFHNQSGKYLARVCNRGLGKRESLGLHSTPIEAHRAWLSRKIEIATEMKDEMDKIDERIYKNVISKINLMV